MYQDEIKELTKLAEAVCPHLESNWFVKKDWEGNGVMITVDQKQLHFYFAWNNDRLIISGSWPNGLSRFLPYNKLNTEITVSKNKAPEVIARDITKRLLPNYEEVLAEILKQKVVEDIYQDNKKVALKKVVEAIGGNAHIIEHSQQVHSYEPYDCTVEYRGGARDEEEQIRLEINLPLEKAFKLLREI